MELRCILVPTVHSLAPRHSDSLEQLLGPLLTLLSQPMFWAVLGILVGPYLFYRGFVLYRRKRFIADIPRCSIRSAAIGAVEISGKAVGPYTLVAPLTQRDCLYYRVVIRVLRNKNGPIVDEVCAPLFIDDGTGELMIFPQGAEMQWACEQSDGGDYLTHVLARHGAERQDLVDAKEYCIEPGDNIFVLGTLRENPWAARDPQATSLSRIGPGFVSMDEADILRHEAFPILNPNLPSGAAADRNFNLYPPTILMKDRSPFVISTHSQREVLSSLGWQSFVFIFGGPLWTLWALWTILGRP